MRFICRHKCRSLGVVESAAFAAFVVLGCILSTANDAKSEKTRIVLVGDSTVTDKGGWGMAFASRLKPEAECLNFARSGSSSKSYADLGYWKQALAQKPQFVLIQFGHNDQPGKGPDRETDPKTTYRENLTRFVEEARQAGARPILVTSMARRNFTPEGKISSTLTPYVDAMKTVANEKKVPLIDLHGLSITLLERVGPTEAKTWGPPNLQDPAKLDSTHLSAKGAEAIAPLVIEALWEVEPEMRACLPTPKKSVLVK